MEYSLLWFNISKKKNDTMTDFDVGAETERNLFVKTISECKDELECSQNKDVEQQCITNA